MISKGIEDLKIGNKKSKGIVTFFEQEYKDILQKLDDLYGATKNLQFEGKLFSGKNMKEIEMVIKFLRNKLFVHLKLDEKVIFPFLEVHIPKLGPVLNLLRAERNEFKMNLENFESLFRKLKKEKNYLENHKILEGLQEKGLYMVCLMRNHIQAENESVYKAIDQELHLDEKRDLIRQCHKFERSPD